MVVAVATLADVTVLVVGVMRQEQAALMIEGAKGARAGGLYPSPDPFGGVQERFSIALTVTVSVTVLVIVDPGAVDVVEVVVEVVLETIAVVLTVEAGKVLVFVAVEVPFTMTVVVLG